MAQAFVHLITNVYESGPHTLGSRDRLGQNSAFQRANDMLRGRIDFPMTTLNFNGNERKCWVGELACREHRVSQFLGHIDHCADVRSNN